MLLPTIREQATAPGRRPQGKSGENPGAARQRPDAYTATDKQRCVGQTTDGGMPSYVEVLECLLVTVGVNNPIPPLQSGAPGGTQQKPLVGVKKAKQQKNQPKTQ